MPNAPADPASGPSAEVHYVTRTGWLRAAVLGANDGLLSTGSLMAGVAAASVSSSQLLLTGVAGLVAGALSMAAGEYVSVASQADAESADEAREQAALAAAPEQERLELAKIYESRGLAPALALEVATQLHASNPLAAHLRDELGMTEANAANPVEAAVASALSFVVGGSAPVAMALLFPGPHVLGAIVAITVAMLALLGYLGARAGGAKLLRGTVRVVLFGLLAMGITALVGRLFHAQIG
jgi:VIT1/CCC1 family predicted Fe2+/Mn2+ transporter